MGLANPIADARMVELYQQGFTSTAIARQINRSQSGVWRSLQRLGVLDRTRSLRQGVVTGRVQRYIELHEAGLSTRQIADREGVKKNTVIHALRRHGKLRKAPGRDVELEVAAWTSRFARSCFRMRGDHPFDLLVDGKRVDVKSANSHNGRHYYEINHRQSQSRHTDHVDEFYLVMCDQPGRPVYSLSSEAVKVVRSLSIPENIRNSKYRLRLLGHLDEAA